VWFGALGWSGQLKLAVEQTSNQLVRVTGGYNPFDFGYLLKPGERPGNARVLWRIHGRGFGEASRLMHRFEREAILPRRAQPRASAASSTTPGKPPRST